jgi:hypothetical protein
MRFGRSGIGIGAGSATYRQVEVSEQDIELLQKRGYEVGDKVSVGQAVSALLSDLVLEAA